MVAIHCNPALDAKDQLRCLFTLLLEHAAKERRAAPDDGERPDAGGFDSEREGHCGA